MPIVDRLIVVDSPPRLAFDSRHAIRMTIRTLAAVPGSYPQESHVPRQICWEPDVLEREESFCVERDYIHLFPSTRPNNASGVNGWQPFFNIVHDNLFGSTQDDNGRVAMAVHSVIGSDRQGRRGHAGRRRACSTPPRYANPRTIYTHQRQWLPGDLHKCVSHRSWKPPHSIRYSSYEQARICLNSPLIGWSDLRLSWEWQESSWEAALVRDKASRDVAGRFMDRFWRDPDSLLRNEWESQCRVDEMDKLLEEHREE